MPRPGPGSGYTPEDTDPAEVLAIDDARNNANYQQTY